MVLGLSSRVALTAEPVEDIMRVVVAITIPRYFLAFNGRNRERLEVLVIIWSKVKNLSGGFSAISVLLFLS